MDQTEFETRLRRLVRQAACEDFKVEGSVVRSPDADVPDYDVEITELRNRIAPSEEFLASDAAE